MQIRIGCLDGNTYESDIVDNKDIQAELDRTGGRIGTGEFRNMEINTVEEFANWMRDMTMGKRMPGGFEPTDVTLVMGGRDRVFKPSAIVWCEVDL